MTVLLQDAIQSVDQKSSPGKKAKDWSALKACAAVFVLTLIPTLLFHWFAEPPRRALCFDARQYFSNSQAVCEFLLSLYKGHPDASLVTGKAFAEAILSDGPVFPGIFGFIFSLIGKVPVVNDWRTLQVIQSIMHAASAGMVCLLGLRMTDKKWLAVLSGLLWGLYPAAIFWSGIFYTETTVVFCVLSFLALITCKTPRLLTALMCGVAAGSVILLKPALAPAAVLACMTLWPGRKNLVAAALGAALTVAPWAAYTKVTTGTARFTAYRNPSFNLAMGADTEVDGCYVWPGAPLTAMFAADECAIAFPLSQWQYHTGDCLRMSARKATCIFGVLSNDLRQSFFGIAPIWLNYFHQALALLGYAGLLIFVCGGFKKLDAWHKRTGFTLLLFAAGHLTYLLFTPTARYGFTAVPMLCVFAAFAIACTANKKLRPNALGIAAASTMLLGWFGLLVFGETIARSHEPKEVSREFNAGETAIKTIDLTGVPAPRHLSRIALLLDADGNAADAEISVNGTVLREKPTHLRRYSSKVYDRCWDLRSLGYPMGIPQDQFRQWKAVLLDSSLIKWGEQNTITLVRKSGQMTLYSDKNPQSRQILSPDYCSVNNVSNSPDCLDPRIVSPVPSAKILQQSAFHAPGANKLVALEGSLRVRLCAVLDEQESPVASGNAKQGAPADFTYAFTPQDFDLYMQDKINNGVRTNKSVLKSALRAGAMVELPQVQSGPNTHLRVVVTGMVKSASTSAGKAGIVVALAPGRGTPSLTLAATPDYVEAEPQWKPFVIEDHVPLELLASGKRSLYFAVYPGAWLDICGYGAGRSTSDVQVKDIRARVSYEAIPDISHGRTIYY